VWPDEQDGGADGVEEGEGNEDVANAGEDRQHDPHVEQGHHRLDHSLPGRAGGTAAAGGQAPTEE
jgi:hypothetical protein